MADLKSKYFDLTNAMKDMATKGSSLVTNTNTQLKNLSNRKEKLLTPETYTGYKAAFGWRNILRKQMNNYSYLADSLSTEYDNLETVYKDLSEK
jgi:hypothetical protein